MFIKEFSLNDNEKKELLKWGYKAEEFEQIEDCVNCGEFETSRGKKVSWLTAKKIVGREEFLSGISRAAFHWTAYRENKRGISIHFDFGKYFKN